MHLSFPLNVRFKLIALAPRMFVTDAAGRNVCYVSQKVLKMKEDIQVFEDESRSRELYRIKADRVIDFSATYRFSRSQDGQEFGAIKSKGWRSIWRATYHVVDAQDRDTHHIQEVNPWVKLGDALLSEVPVLGLFTGYFLNPSYAAYDVTSEQMVMKLIKEPAFFEGHYRLERLDDTLDDETSLRLMLGFMLMIQFMRRRG